MAAANNHNTPHWSQDFVEHIRTVHFSLIAVCLALVGLLQFQKPKDVSLARSQLADIKSAVDNWGSQEVSGAVRNAVARAGGMPTPPNQNVGKFTIASLGWIVALAPTSCIWTAPVTNGQGECLTNNAWNEQMLKKPATLAAFRDLWDQFSRKTEVITADSQHVAEKAIIIDASGSPSIVTYDPAPGSPNSYSFPDIRFPDPKEKNIIGREFPGISFGLVYYQDDNATKQRLLVPVPIASRTPVRVQAALIATHSYWKPGPFGTAFAEVNLATAGIQQNSFETIASNLADEAAKPKPDSFEVFGVKFPVETASRWGVVLIIGLQLYLWVHLHELSPRLKEADPGWDVAWIGVYQSLPARALFIACTAVLPFLTIGLLGRHALEQSRNVVWIMYVAALVVSLLLSILSLSRIPARRPQSKPSRISQAGKENKAAAATQG